MRGEPAMTASTPGNAEPGEPSSYEQIEKALSRVASKPGENTQEKDEGGRQMFTQGTKARPWKDKSTSSSENSKTTTFVELPCTGESADHSRKPAPLCSLDSQVDYNFSGIVADGVATEKSCPPNESNELALAPTRHDDVVLRKTARKDSVDLRLSRPSIGTESQSISTPDVSGPPRIVHAQMSTTNLASHSPSTSTQSTGQSGKNKIGISLRRGKWTMEEEAYVARVIQDFNSGFLNAPAGTTLRSYLSEKLQCDPMRITKKFTGDACIGKRVFHPAVRSAANASSIDKAQAELDALERRWRRRLEMQQRESAKKAAASAAAANSTAQGRGQPMVQGVPIALLGGAGSDPRSSPSIGSTDDKFQQHAVAQAASWLDRANAILKGSKTVSSGDTGTGSTEKYADIDAESFDSMPSNEIENQMKEVQRLIYEGPIIRKTTAGLPDLLSQSEQGNTRQCTSETVQCDSSSPIDRELAAEPADKRMRTSTLSGAEDAEALVGFLRSVRAAARQETL